jgi:hypothetical protein
LSEKLIAPALSAAVTASSMRWLADGTCVDAPDAPPTKRSELLNAAETRAAVMREDDGRGTAAL